MEVVRSETHRGPLPPASLLKQYEEVLPGAADRVFCMAEEQQRHVQSMDNKAISLTAAERERGQWLGFGAALAAFATAGVCAYLKAFAAAGIIGGATAVGIVSIFVLGKLVRASKDDDDDEEKKVKVTASESQSTTKTDSQE